MSLRIKLGVIVQVSRKSGNVWNVISITEGWTLESQNSAGEFISSEMTMPSRKTELINLIILLKPIQYYLRIAAIGAGDNMKNKCRYRYTGIFIFIDKPH
jgi:hypothetical protein